MSEGLNLHDPATASTVTAVTVAALAWLGQRLVGKAAIQEAINKGFHELLEQLRQELRVALTERDAARGTVEELRATIGVLEARLRTLQAAPRC